MLDSLVGLSGLIRLAGASVTWVTCFCMFSSWALSSECRLWDAEFWSCRLWRTVLSCSFTLACWSRWDCSFSDNSLKEKNNSCKSCKWRLQKMCPIIKIIVHGSVIPETPGFIMLQHVNHKFTQASKCARFTYDQHWPEVPQRHRQWQPTGLWQSQTYIYGSEDLSYFLNGCSGLPDSSHF